MHLINLIELWSLCLKVNAWENFTIFFTIEPDIDVLFDVKVFFWFDIKGDEVVQSIPTIRLNHTNWSVWVKYQSKSIICEKIHYEAIAILLVSNIILSISEQLDIGMQHYEVRLSSALYLLCYLLIVMIIDFLS